MISDLLDAAKSRTTPVVLGIATGIGWLLLLYSAINLSSTLSFSSDRTQMIGVVMNSFSTFILIVLYAMLVIETSRQSDIQKEQKRMMEFDSGTTLILSYSGYSPSGPIYQVHNRGPGMILNIGVETRQNGTELQLAAKPSDEHSAENVGVLRAGEEVELILPYEVEFEGEILPIGEYHKRLCEREAGEETVEFGIYAENGSGNTTKNHLSIYNFGQGQFDPEDVFDRRIRLDVN
jgi:hypothetical protein